MKGKDEGKKLSLQEIQDEAYQVLLAFDDLCKRWNLTYFLAYGTLLGAVRHQDFIPWDDDLDVWMPREDFDWFRAYCFSHEKELLPYRLCGRENTRHYPYYIPRFSNQELSFEFSEPHHPTPRMGVFLDVYPLDNFCSSEESRIELQKRTWKINQFFSAYVDGRSFSKGSLDYRKWGAHVLSLILHGWGYQRRVNRRIEKLVFQNTDDSDEFIGVPTWDCTRYPRAYFEEIGFQTIRDRIFPVSNKYHEILSQLYGNYMELPPEENRKPYHMYDIYDVRTEEEKEKARDRMFKKNAEWRSFIKWVNNKKEKNSKKVIVYNTTIPMLLKHREKMLKKMKTVFDYFLTAKDEFVLLWKPITINKVSRSLLEPTLCEAYEKLEKWYRREDVGLIDDGSDCRLAVALADAYYGDLSSIIPMFQQVGLPIMIENVDVLTEDMISKADIP